METVQLSSCARRRIPHASRVAHPLTRTVHLTYVMSLLPQMRMPRRTFISQHSSDGRNGDKHKYSLCNTTNPMAAPISLSKNQICPRYCTEYYGAQLTCEHERLQDGGKSLSGGKGQFTAKSGAKYWRCPPAPRRGL